MKNKTKKILIFLLALLFIPFSAQALIAYPLNQGGTGWDTSTKGDLLVGTSSISKYSRLPVGSDGYVITASSTSPIGLTWIATSTLAAGLNHNALYNLTTGDVHTQYAYLAGRSGGQTIIGGTASGNNLTLQSTANATKGKIYLGSTSFYDESTDRLRLGGAITGVQTFKLSLKGDATNAASITLENVNNHQWHFGGSTGLDRFYITKTGVIDYITLDYPADTITFSPASVFGKTLFSQGNVGIGTASPGEKLQVAGAVKVTGTTAVGLANSGSFDVLSGVTRLLAFGPNTGTLGQLQISVLTSNAGSSALGLSVNASGNVGVNTSNAGSNFTVAKNGNGVSISANSGGSAFALNREASTGAIFNSAQKAYQFTQQGFGFETQEYSGVGAFIGRTILNDGNFGIVGTDGTTSATNRFWVNGNMAIGGATYKAATAPTNGLLVEGNVGIGLSSGVGAPLHVTGAQTWTTSGWYKGIRLEGLNSLELGGGSGTPWGMGVSGGAMYIYNANGESSAATPSYVGLFNVAGLAVGPTANINSLAAGSVSFHSKLGAIFGASSVFYIIPDYGGSGDLPAGSFMGGGGTNSSMGFAPSAAGGVAGAKMVLAYYNGSAWKSALEYANTSAGALTDLYLQKNGGNIAVGTTSAPSSPLTIAYSNTSTTSAIRITGPNGSTEKRAIRFESTGTSNADTMLEFNGNTSASGKYGISWFNASSSSYLMFLDKGGNLGIGTTSPGRKLTISDNSNTNGASGLRIEDTASTTAGTYSIVSGSVAIGTLSIRDDYAGLTRVSLASNGNFGVATSTPAFKFSVSGSIGVTGLTSSATGNAICIATNGELINAGGGTCTPSSIRFKENVSSLKKGTALETLNKLRAVSFDYKEKQPYETNHSYGVIAEEVEQIDPNLVDYGADGQIYGVHFEKITGLLIQAVQELSIRQSLAKAKRSVEENWQWVAIGLLALMSFRQQLQIRKLTK